MSTLSFRNNRRFQIALGAALVALGVAVAMVFMIVALINGGSDTTILDAGLRPEISWSVPTDTDADLGQLVKASSLART